MFDNTQDIDNYKIFVVDCLNFNQQYLLKILIINNQLVLLNEACTVPLQLYYKIGIRIPFEFTID